jgi:glutamine synthetase
MSHAIQDYVFIDGDGQLRTKNKVERYETMAGRSYGTVNPLKMFLEFATDGSSTNQASESGNTEIILRPVSFFETHTDGLYHYLVLCDTYDAVTKQPLSSNSRAKLAALFEEPRIKALGLWFGPEQEYYLKKIISDNCSDDIEPGKHYCGVSNNFIQQQIVNEHMRICIKMGLKFHGTNAEVSNDQWEFQLGPCEGVRAADELWIARFLLERIASKYGYRVCYNPKPFQHRHGSGCHHNFSTVATRKTGGFDKIVELMPKFEATHKAHIAVYGKGNEDRLTGKCETASMDTFSWGIGTRNTSMRVSNKVREDGCGYVEDRRPAANVDPYDALFMIAKTCSE